MKQVDVIFLKPGTMAAMAYFQEDRASLSENVARELIQKKIVAEIRGEFTPVPKNMPYRIPLLENGYYSMEQLQKVDSKDFIVWNGDQISIARILQKYKKTNFLNSL